MAVMFGGTRDRSGGGKCPGSRAGRLPQVAPASPLGLLQIMILFFFKLVFSIASSLAFPQDAGCVSLRPVFCVTLLSPSVSPGVTRDQMQIRTKVLSKSGGE